AVCLVHLAPLADAGLVVPAIAQALGVAEVANRPRLAVLIETLRDARWLLVLDNFEHVPDAAPAIAALLEACPDVRALVTSRAVLRLAGEHVVAVPPLAFPEPP